MIYTPQFECKHCGRVKAAHVSGNQGLFVPCDCKEARDAWEREHRAAMERRKKARRRGRKRRK